MGEEGPEILEGRYFPSGGSMNFAANLRAKGDQLIITDTESAEVIYVKFQELSDRLANVPRKVLFEDGSVFECLDNEAVDKIFGRERHFFSRLSSFEQSSKFIVFALIATFAVVALLYQYGLPLASQFAAWATPTRAVELIDEGALDTVDRVIFKPSQMSNKDKERYQELFTELLEASDAEPDHMRLLFRDGGRLGANAVALPGGTIILTDQLAALAENDDQIAGVLAHELGHVSGRHSLRQIYRALGIAFMAAIIIGDTTQLLDNVVSQVALLDTLSYSRSFEAEADATSVEIMSKLNRDPMAFIDLIDNVFKEADVEGNKTGWLSTHPSNKDRRKDVLKLIETNE